MFAISFLINFYDINILKLRFLTGVLGQNFNDSGCLTEHIDCCLDSVDFTSSDHDVICFHELDIELLRSFRYVLEGEEGGVDLIEGFQL